MKRCYLLNPAPWHKKGLSGGRRSGFISFRRLTRTFFYIIEQRIFQTDSSVAQSVEQMAVNPISGEKRRIGEFEAFIWGFGRNHPRYIRFPENNR